MMKQYTDAEVAIWNEAVAACEAALLDAVEKQFVRFDLPRMKPQHHYLARVVTNMYKKTADQIRADKIERIRKILEE
jgi:hypothetical protein